MSRYTAISDEPMLVQGQKVFIVLLVIKGLTSKKTTPKFSKKSSPYPHLQIPDADLLL